MFARTVALRRLRIASDVGGYVRTVAFRNSRSPEPTMVEAFALQAQACEALGSAQYARLLVDLRTEIDHGGALSDLLASRTERPLRDAVPLRLLGAVHRIVLRGHAPALAARYQSAGGDGGRIDVRDVLAAIDEHRADVVEALGAQVQTNEVGRSAFLVAGFAAVARRVRRPLALLELGASAGLNLNWPHYWFESGDTGIGDPSSALRFDHVWAEPVDLSGLDVDAALGSRGCDMAPVDATDASGRLRLLSFVWPDQPERFRRLEAALDIAAMHPPQIDRADAARWLAERLAERRADACTVVYHSIVWQYLSPTTQAAVRDTLEDHGRRASAHAPLAWLRMEPAGPVAELRLTLWAGAPTVGSGTVGSGTVGSGTDGSGTVGSDAATSIQEVVLGTAGYHGADIRVHDAG
jgi:hypothetical protein